MPRAQRSYENLGWARIDLHRKARRGYPEIIFAESKTPLQLIKIVRQLLLHRQPVLLTRLSPAVFGQIRASCPRLAYDPAARLAFSPSRKQKTPHGLVVVATGGTSDIPVAEEAAVALSWMGSRVERLYDVGVAGIHRVLSHWRLLRRARVIVVVAGMEGALPSVVAGIVKCPVIAVPTSIGYGASFKGVAPLLAMMNSCVPGIGVVNIDNGFGAAYLAHVINCPSI